MMEFGLVRLSEAHQFWGIDTLQDIIIINEISRGPVEKKGFDVSVQIITSQPPHKALCLGEAFRVQGSITRGRIFFQKGQDRSERGDGVRGMGQDSFDLEAYLLGTHYAVGQQ